MHMKNYSSIVKSKSTIVVMILVAVFAAVMVVKFVDGHLQQLAADDDDNDDNKSTSYIFNDTSYSSHTNSNRTYFYSSDDRPYFYYGYEDGFCIDLKNNKLSDMANCKLEDKIEKRMLLSDEVPLLRDDKDNDTIFYDLPPPLTEDEEKNIFSRLAISHASAAAAASAAVRAREVREETTVK